MARAVDRAPTIVKLGGLICGKPVAFGTGFQSNIKEDDMRSKAQVVAWPEIDDIMPIWVDLLRIFELRSAVLQLFLATMMTWRMTGDFWWFDWYPPQPVMWPESGSTIEFEFGLT